jgi:hypothetical protein
VFRQLAAAAGQQVEVRMVAPGGWRLGDHWEKGEARSALAGGKWDYVVLQDQSTLGVNFYVDGRVRVAGDEVFRPAADAWAAEVHRSGARPVFYLTWARLATPEDQAALTLAYMSAARSSRALVAPVGLAWQLMRREHPAIGLFAADGSHPSPAGTYLAACTLVSAMLDRNPLGLPATLSGHPVSLETGQMDAARTAALVDLPAPDARALQTAAWSTWQDLKSHGGYIDVVPVPPPAAAPLPAAVRIGTSALEGTWVGTLTLHPAGPAKMTLRFEHGAGGWTGRVEIEYPSQELPRETADLRAVDAGDGEVRFAISSSSALSNIPVELHAVAVGPDEFRGTADARSRSTTSPLRLLGTWQVRRQR